MARVTAGDFMDELIDRIVAAVGIDRITAEKAAGLILDFLVKEGPAEQVKALMERLPGAEGAISATGLSDAAGNFAMGGIMGVGSRLMGLGLNMGQVQGITRETIGFAREKAGEDVVGEIVGAIPGLSQFA